MYVLEANANRYTAAEDCCSLQQGPEPSSAGRFPTLRYGDPAEAAHHLDMLIVEGAHILAQAPLEPKSSASSRATRKKEALFLLECLNSWHTAARKAVFSRVMDTDSEEALAWDNHLERCRVARTSCQEVLEALRSQEMGPVSVPSYQAGVLTSS